MRLDRMSDYFGLVVFPAMMVVLCGVAFVVLLGVAALGGVAVGVRVGAAFFGVCFAVIGLGWLIGLLRDLQDRKWEKWNP